MTTIRVFPFESFLPSEAIPLLKPSKQFYLVFQLCHKVHSRPHRRSWEAGVDRVLVRVRRRTVLRKIGSCMLFRWLISGMTERNILILHTQK